MENKTKVILGVGGIVVVLLLLKGGANQSNAAIDWGVPFGGMFPPNSDPAGFNTQIDVKADPNLLGMLDQKYMPLFGFVGMTSTGSLPGTINVSSVTVMQSMAANSRPPERVQVPVNSIWYDDIQNIAKRYGARFTNRPPQGMYEVQDKEFINGYMWYLIDHDGVKKWVNPTNNQRT